jgi:hypothetical protein
VPRTVELVLAMRRIALTALLVGSVMGGCRCQSTEQAADVQKEGETSVLVIDGKKVALPNGEAPRKLFRDESGKRFAYDLADGFRLVYVVGDGMFAGPTLARGNTIAPDFANAPPVEKALGAIFENAGAKRSDLVREVKKLGDRSVATMLADGAYVDDKLWDETFASLPSTDQETVKTSLAAYLQPKKPAAGLRRAVLYVPLGDPARKDLLAARVRELSDPIQEPRANAVLLRALAPIDKPESVKVACFVLAKVAAAPKKTTPSRESCSPRRRCSPLRTPKANVPPLRRWMPRSWRSRVAPTFAADRMAPSMAMSRRRRWSRSVRGRSSRRPSRPISSGARAT